MPRKFSLNIMNTNGLIYRGDIESLRVQGDETEYEIMAFHYPVMSVFTKGRVIIDQSEYMNIKNGILRFSENECVILTE